MNTDDLINALSKESPAVKRLPSINIRCLLWLVVVFTVLTVSIVMIGPREDLAQCLTRPATLLQFGLLAGCGLLSGLTALRLSIPGVEEASRRKWMAIALPVLWLGYLSVSSYQSPSETCGDGISCAMHIALLSLLPTITLVILCRKAAPLYPYSTGLLVFMAAAAFGTLGTQLVCQNDSAKHILLWHFLPMAVATLAGLTLGNSLFRQPSESRPTSKPESPHR